MVISRTRTSEAGDFYSAKTKPEAKDNRLKKSHLVFISCVLFFCFLYDISFIELEMKRKKRHVSTRHEAGEDKIAT
jgi:glycopeptide antibiotics resistance protein